MKKGQIYKWIGCMAAGISILLSGALPARAQSPADIRIPIQQTVENAEGQAETFEYVLESKSEGAPMPEGAQGQTCSFRLEGNAQTQLHMQADRTGIYSYSLRQSIAGERSGWELDQQVYDVEVYVENGKGDELLPVVIIKNASQEKPAQAEFTNRYVVKKPQAAESRRQPGKSSHSKSRVKTGDKSPVVIFSITLAVSLLLLALVVLLKVKRSRRRAE